MENHFLDQINPEFFICKDDWPKNSESEMIEQLVLEVAQDITGNPDISPTIWQTSNPHALAHEERNTFLHTGYNEGQAIYFHGLQMWCDHTEAFLDYLVAFKDEEEPKFFKSESEMTSAESAVVSYDVAISFAGEDRGVAKEIADGLRDNGKKVFYDEYEKATLWGRDLYSHLSNVYKNKARYCVIVISSYYVEKLWTRHELRAAQARAFEENSDYILPLRIDDTDVEGLLPTVGYLHLASNSPGEVVSVLINKLDA